ncbi:polysaccharide pyruvyl transferase family protein [Winogradskyella luteola]|nr:polysaccharide pyruvyl transferase family protein [Winogradskyella luteola]
MKGKIRLFWWSEVFLMNKSKENYGDLLGAHLVEKISKKKVEFTNPKKHNLKDLWSPIYVTIGSILMHINKKCIVWGSGIIKNNQPIKPARFLAVRGPETRRALIQQGYNVPEVYGDPALLLPKYFSPKVKKKYKLGIIPHYVDYQSTLGMYKNKEDICIIDLMTNDIEKTTTEILECERIISSSLHGLIVPHAYQIPAVWVRFSDKLFGDDIKFKDYFASVEIPYYEVDKQNKPLTSHEIDGLFKDVTVLPKADIITMLQEGLLNSCPFID